MPPNEQVVLERFADYHKGWDGSQFDQILIRVVPENGTRRQLIESGADALTFSLTPDDVAALQGNPDLQGPDLRHDQRHVGHHERPGSRPRRSAKGFSYAFPYDQVADGAYKGC